MRLAEMTAPSSSLFQSSLAASLPAEPVKLAIGWPETCSTIWRALWMMMRSFSRCKLKICSKLPEPTSLFVCRPDRNNERARNRVNRSTLANLKPPFVAHKLARSTNELIIGFP